MEQYVKTIFFNDKLFWFLEHTQNFEVAVRGATRMKELKPKSLRKFNLKTRAFKRILDLN